MAETGSTNDDVMSLARAGESEGFWLRADRQLLGRGRQGRGWQAPAGNLSTSTLVRLRTGDPPASSLAFVAAVALHESLAAFLDQTALATLLIKWPNDLLIDGAKISGILLEREEESVVIGIGVNLQSAPQEANREATCLAAHGASVTPDIFLAELAGDFAKWLGVWRENGLDRILKTWLAQAHPIGASLEVHDPSGQKIGGTFDGLGDGGALRLRLADGSAHVMHAGDVFLI